MLEHIILLLGLSPWLVVAVSWLEITGRHLLYWTFCLDEEHSPELCTQSHILLFMWPFLKEYGRYDGAVAGTALLMYGSITNLVAYVINGLLKHHHEVTLAILIPTVCTLGVLLVVRFLAKRLWQHQGKLTNHETRITKLEKD